MDWDAVGMAIATVIVVGAIVVFVADVVGLVFG
jgi:hypothetical protein